MSGVVLAESEQVYKVVDGSHFSHTAGICNRHRIQLVKYPGQQFKLLCWMLSQPDAPAEEICLTGDYNLEPTELEQVVREPFTIKADSETVGEVISAGPFAGEDALLYNWQLKRHGTTSMLQRLGLRPGRHPVVRLAFEEQLEAQNWYALVALCMGLIRGDHSFITSSSSDMVRSASHGILFPDDAAAADGAAPAPAAVVTAAAS